MSAPVPPEQDARRLAPRRIGWVVDVQHDFVRPPAEGGRLYVHDLFDAADAGAVQAMPAIVRTVDWMRAHCDALVYTGDWHAYGDREIDPVAPDPARETYPPHCMGLSDDPAERAGAALAEEIAPADPVVLGRDASEAAAGAALDAVLRERRPLFVQKREFSVFAGNTGAEALVRGLAARLAAPDGTPPEFVVCGVATDVCVKAAVEGLLERGQRVVVVADATWGLGLERDAALFARWAAGGAEVTDTASLERRR